MNVAKKDILLFMLVVLVTLSTLELNGHQGAVLFLCIAGLFWLVTKHPRMLLPPVAFIILAYILAFPIPYLLSDIYPDLLSGVTVNAQAYAMLWAVRGFGAFALGYVLVEQLDRGINRRKWQNESFCRIRIRYTVYVLTSIGWIAILSWIATVLTFGFSLAFIEGEGNIAADSGTGTLVQVLTLLSSLRYPFFLGFLALHYWNKRDRQLHFIIAALLVISVIDIITIGSKGEVIRLVVVALLVLAVVPARVNFKSFCAGALAIIAVYGSFAVIYEYRSIMRSELSAGKDVFSFTTQSEAFLDALSNSLPFSETLADRKKAVDEQTVRTQDVVSRFGSGMFSLANLLEFTGRLPPYEHAWKSFLVPAYSIIPRSLLPDKPEFFNSGRNAKEYYGWSFGGIDVTLPGSFYYAWGYAGIIFGMAFLGGLLAFIAVHVRLWSIYSPHWLILLMALMLPMLDVGVTFHAMTTNLIRIVVLLWLVHLSYGIMHGMIRRRMSKVSGWSHVRTRT